MPEKQLLLHQTWTLQTCKKVFSGIKMIPASIFLIAASSMVRFCALKEFIGPASSVYSELVGPINSLSAQCDWDQRNFMARARFWNFLHIPEMWNNSYIVQLKNTTVILLWRRVPGFLYCSQCLMWQSASNMNDKT